LIREFIPIYGYPPPLSDPIRILDPGAKKALEAGSGGFTILIFLVADLGHFKPFNFVH
jgi:hypothetical protein